MRITNGSVTFSQVLKDADYGVNRKAEYTLSFTLDDDDSDEQDLLALAGQIACKQVSHLLGKPLEKVEVKKIEKPSQDLSFWAKDRRPINIAPAEEAAAPASPPGDAEEPKKRVGRPPKQRLTPQLPDTPLEKAITEKPPVMIGKAHAATGSVADVLLGKADALVMTEAERKAHLYEMAAIKGGPAIRELATGNPARNIPAQPWYKTSISADCPEAQWPAFMAAIKALPSRPKD